MKIGVAIPCYKGHIIRLFELLDSIEKQTRHPDKVVVSCSSTSEFLNSKDYSFPLQIIITEQHKNAAQNRNIAITKLSDMDYITFIDADDTMHPQRIEILLKVFEEHDCDVILHNFFMNSNESNEFIKIENIQVKPNSLKQCWSDRIVHKDTDNNTHHIHHGQVTLKRYILDKVNFPEEVEFNWREDSVFCHKVFGLENIKNAYIVNELSYYSPSKTGGFIYL